MLTEELAVCSGQGQRLLSLGSHTSHPARQEGRPCEFLRVCRPLCCGFPVFYLLPRAKQSQTHNKGPSSSEAWVGGPWGIGPFRGPVLDSSRYSKAKVKSGPGGLGGQSTAKRLWGVTVVLSGSRGSPDPPCVSMLSLVMQNRGVWKQQKLTESWLFVNERLDDTTYVS